MILLLVPRATLSREPPSVRREDRTAQPTPTNPINVALGPPLSTPAPSALRRLRPAPALVRRPVASRLPGAGHRLSLAKRRHATESPAPGRSRLSSEGLDPIPCAATA